MRLTSRDVLKEYARYGVNYDVLRYARNTGRLKCYIEKNALPYNTDPDAVHYEYEREDVDAWIRDYMRPKGQRRGRWRGYKNERKQK
jgi:hypothetical protein